MREKTGYVVIVTERPDPTTGLLRLLPRGVSERISSLFQSRVSEVRASSVKPTSLTRAQRIAAKEIEIGNGKKITETTILPEPWNILNGRERRRQKKIFAQSRSAFLLASKR